MAARNILLEETEKPERGTDIVLHINEDSDEFLGPGKNYPGFSKNSAGFCPFLSFLKINRSIIHIPPGPRNHLN